MSSLRFLPLSIALSFGLAAPVGADGLAGPYLAGRVASIETDYAAAADYFAQALYSDPKNVGILESAVLAHIGAGNFDKAITVARGLEGAGVRSSIADLTVLASLAQQEQYKAALAELDKGRSAGVLVDGLFRAWAQLGDGQMSDATASFDKVAEQKALAPFALYHKALALASVGDFEGADKILSGEAAGPIRATRRSVIAHTQILSQLERNPAAVELIDKTFGADTDDKLLAAMRADLVAGKTLPFSLIASPKDGLAEVFYAVAAVLAADSAPNDKGAPIDALLFARTAAYLRPDFSEANLLVAGSLEQQGQHDLAIATYALIDPASAEHITAELGRADALAAENKPDAAIEALQQLAKNEPGHVDVWAALGDMQRRNQHFVDAIGSYDKAVELVKMPGKDHWVLFYARGISHERQKEWPEAEADFRKALSLSPDQPQVLNYLGYSYLEKKMNLDEAMAMIERASKARPDDGAITDSLGWALYQQGHYDKAAPVMEKAIQLMPVDPVVNDHLGDVYWAVGRKREAEFQWKRALSFKPDTEEEAARIRRKLEVGLDEVLKEEGEAPLAVSNNDG